jgi:hypothetical protein
LLGLFARKSGTDYPFFAIIKQSVRVGSVLLDAILLSFALFSVRKAGARKGVLLSTQRAHCDGHRARTLAAMFVLHYAKHKRVVLWPLYALGIHSKQKKRQWGWSALVMTNDDAKRYDSLL